MEAVKRQIFKAVKIRGLNISSEATEALVNVITREPDLDGSLKLILNELKDRIDRQEVKSGIIDVATIESIVADLSSNEEDLKLESFQLFDAFSSPKLTYDEKQRTYKCLPHNPHVVSDIEQRTAVYRERLILTQQRLLRSELFTLKTRNRSGSETDELSTIESLLGSTGTKVLLGYLTQPLGGEGLAGVGWGGGWHLEDLTGSIKLDLTNTLTYPLLYTEGSIVVVQGVRGEDNVFRVQVMGLPPAEERANTLKAMNMIDTFGSLGFNNTQHYMQMQLLEQSAQQLVVIISELHLDDPMVLEQFSRVLEGFDANLINPLYILMGSFFSKPLYLSAGGRGSIRAGFEALAEVISKVPNQCENSKFLLIPGPNDPGLDVALPRRPLPAHLTSALTQAVPHVTFGSNPCRLRVYTQEVCIFRYDILKKMKQHLAVPLKVQYAGEGVEDEELGEDEVKDEENEDEAHITSHQLSPPTPSPAVPSHNTQVGDNSATPPPSLPEQLVESLLDQAHLSPLPALSCPVYWEADYALRLTPLPNLLILADQCEVFSFEYKGCHAVCPGSFAAERSFVVYEPSTQSIQVSKVT